MTYTKKTCDNCGKNITDELHPLCKKCFIQTVRKTKEIDEEFDVEYDKESGKFFFIFQNERVNLDIIANEYEKGQEIDKLLNAFSFLGTCTLNINYFSFLNRYSIKETILTLKIFFEGDPNNIHGGIFTIENAEMKNKIIDYIRNKYGENLVVIKK